jgi:hypothetical protein
MRLSHVLNEADTQLYFLHTVNATQRGTFTLRASSWCIPVLILTNVQYQIQMSGQHHVPATLTLWEVLRVCIAYEAVLAVNIL